MTRATALRALTIAAVLLVGGVLALRWWQGEERVIVARLDSLAETLSPPAGGELAMVGRIVQLRSLFAPDVHIRFGTEDVVSRDALLALLSRWEPPSAGLTIEFVDVTVTLEDDSTARVGLTATISDRNAQTGDPIIDAREATLAMRKLDGEWVVAGVESTDTLQRP